MKTWNCKVEFTTTHVLGQDAAQEFWGRGDRFHATGPKQYEWTAQVDADGLYSAQLHVTTAAAGIVLKSGISSLPEFVRLSIEQADVAADRVPEAMDSV